MRLPAHASVACTGGMRTWKSLRRVFVGNNPAEFVMAVAAKERMALFPNVPTAADAGVANYEANSWFGIAAPAGTPAPIVARLAKEIAAAVRTPAMQERFAKTGAQLVGAVQGPDADHGLTLGIEQSLAARHHPADIVLLGRHHLAEAEIGGGPGGGLAHEIRQPGEIGLALEDETVTLLFGQHVLGELRSECREARVDLGHALLDLFEIVRREWLGPSEVVVETILDGRTNCYLRAGKQFLHRLRHHVRGVVSQQFECVGVLRRDDGEVHVVVDLALEISHLAIYADGQGRLGQPGANIGGDIHAGHGFVVLADLAVGKSDCNHRSRLFFKSAEN